MPSLIADDARRRALVAVVVCVVVTAALAATVWRTTGNAVDNWAFTRAALEFGGPSSTRREMWLWFSEPVISILGSAAIAVWGLVTRRWTVAALAAAGPLLALGITELVLKPLVGRILGPRVMFDSLAGAQSGSFPSGHETGLVGFLTVALVVLLPRLRSARARAAAVGVAAVWAAAGCLGLVVNYYHYATDTIGAIASTTAVVLGVALLIDRYGSTVAARVRPRQPVS